MISRTMLFSLFLLVFIVGFSKFADANKGRLFKKPSNRKCSSYRSNCGLTDIQARMRLTSYNDLSSEITRLMETSIVPMKAGPIFKTSAVTNGLLDIDINLTPNPALDVNFSVCGGTNASPTIRDAVICTVSQGSFPEPGNRDPSKIGMSNSGRNLLAVRFGNPDGVRVMVVTQQHGDEPAGTEGALRFLKDVGQGKYKKIVKNLDVLVMLRVNVDGGDPEGERPPFDGPFLGSSGFFRQNLDRTAGGGFQTPTEDDFFGVVGRGYDINRYIYFGLNSPIRPVESQAVVAAGLAFLPAFIFDLHGDVQKVACEIDLTSVSPPRNAVILPTVKCAGPGTPLPSLNMDRKRVVVSSISSYDRKSFIGPAAEAFVKTPAYTKLIRQSRNIAADIISNVGSSVPGTYARFSQIQIPGSSILSPGFLTRSSTQIGAVGTTIEVLNFNRVARPTISRIRLVNGTLTPTNGLEAENLEACFLEDSICIHENNLKEGLDAVVRIAPKSPTGDGGYCSFPVATGSYVEAPKIYFGDQAVEESLIVPQAGLLNIPLSYVGQCEGDIVP